MSIFFATVSASNAQEWKFLYQKEDISVYTNEQQKNLSEFKAVGILDVNIYEVLAVLNDLSRRTEWVENLSEIRVLSGDPESEAIIYNRFDLPWPASDRESIIKVTVNPDYVNQFVVINFVNEKAYGLAKSKDVVRVPIITGSNYLKRIDNTTTEVAYNIQMDTGGYIPKWISEIFVEKVPIKTIQALKKQVMRTRGQYDEFVLRHKKKSYQVQEQ